MNKWFTKRMLMHLAAGSVTAAVVVATYLLGVYVPPGVFSYVASLLPLSVLFITALARANDIKEDKVEKRWQLRRAGLSIVAAASVIAMLGPVAALAGWPSWNTVALYWGVALTWFTTPSMPPWWRWISGREKIPRNVELEGLAD